MRTILCLILISFSALAGPYIAGSLGQYEQQATSVGDLNEDLLLQGNGVGLYLGYKKSFFAVEGLYKSYSAKASDGDKNFKFTNTVKGLGARIYLLSFFNFKFGTLIHDASGKIKEAGITSFEYESTQSTAYSGAGANFNFGKLDIFMDVNFNSQEDDESSSVEIKFQELEMGARYYF